MVRPMSREVAAAPGTGVRARRRAEVEARLLEVGREHLRTSGAAALSVRAVARDLGMAPSALFRYIAGRDELLTLLIVDGFTSAADAVEPAVQAVPVDDHARRWQTLAHGVRAWALEHPHQWSLLYGSPVPDYQAPGEQTMVPGTRLQLLLAQIGADAQAARAAGGPLSRPGTDGEEQARRAAGDMLATPELAPLDLSPVVLANGLQAWMLLVGAVSTEVFQGLGADAPMDEIFDYTVTVGEALLLGPA